MMRRAEEGDASCLLFLASRLAPPARPRRVARRARDGGPGPGDERRRRARARGRAREDGGRRARPGDGQVLLAGARAPAGRRPGGRQGPGVPGRERGAGGAQGGLAERVAAVRARLAAEAVTRRAARGGAEAVEERDDIGDGATRGCGARSRRSRRGGGHLHAQADGHGARAAASAGVAGACARAGTPWCMYAGRGESRELRTLRGRGHPGGGGRRRGAACCRRSSRGSATAAGRGGRRSSSRTGASSGRIRSGIRIGRFPAREAGRAARREREAGVYATKLSRFPYRDLYSGFRDSFGAENPGAIFPAYPASRPHQEIAIGAVHGGRTSLDGSRAFSRRNSPETPIETLYTGFGKVSGRRARE